MHVKDYKDAPLTSSKDCLTGSEIDCIWFNREAPSSRLDAIFADSESTAVIPTMSVMRDLYFLPLHYIRN